MLSSSTPTPGTPPQQQPSPPASPMTPRGGGTAGTPVSPRSPPPPTLLQVRASLFKREGTWLYVCRHAERLDTVFPNWMLLFRTDPARWPPGFRETLPFPAEHLAFLGDLHPVDTPLTARGVSQARTTAESLRGAGIGHIFSSPMLRCVQTAQQFSEVLHLPIKIEPFAMETLDERWYPVLPTMLRWDAALGERLNTRIDPTYKSPFTLPVAHERLSDWTERSIALLRHVTRDDFLATGKVIVITHGFSVTTLPWIALSEHPPVLGYCCLASLDRRPFTAVVRMGTDQLETQLPSSVVESGSTVLWLAAAAGVTADEGERLVLWRDSAPHGQQLHASQPREHLRPRVVRARTLRRIAVAAFDGLDDCIVTPVFGSYRSFTLAVLLLPASFHDIMVLLSADPLKDSFVLFHRVLHSAISHLMESLSNGMEIRVDKMGSVAVFAGNVAVAIARGGLTVDRWSLVVLRVRNGREARMWVDFTRVVAGGSIPSGSPPFGSWQGLHIGGGSSPATVGTNPFHGSIAEVLLVGVALDDSQIDTLHSYYISKFA